MCKLCYCGPVLIRQTLKGRDAGSSTKATVADGHTVFRRASRPDGGAKTAMIAVAGSKIPALIFLSLFMDLYLA